MPCITSEEFFIWEKKQLSKGGDKQSLYLLIDLKAGITSDKINSLKINPEQKLYLKEKLDLLEAFWDNHILKSTPIQYLCGFTYWRDLKLKVSEKVLIPRPETELLVEIVQSKFKKNHQKVVFAELGTGSGAISISLALANPLWEGYATDIDKNALEIASRNFTNFSKQSNLKFCLGNWWNPLENLKGDLDFVISNPPYIPKNIYEKLPESIKNFEPKLALIGGEDGLDSIRDIVRSAPIYLKKKGWLILENHFDQGSKVRELFQENNFTSIQVLKDFSGIGRFTIGRYK